MPKFAIGTRCAPCALVDGGLFSGGFMGTTLGGNLPHFALSVPGMRVLGGQTNDIPGAIREKLRPENRTDLGSTTELGRVFDTSSTDYYHIQDVLNAYLHQPLTEDELEYILDNRDQYAFHLGYGDRRDAADLIRRFTYAENWQGEDVRDFVLEPEANPSQTYNFRLLFDSRAKVMKLTDSHVVANRYGALRALYVTEMRTT
ncbi:hypothetical protein HUK76_23125 [Citrobacter portucalensis]|uniref:hypothetical protein n=1 Tax=Citrobacter portucalensis TaxID=1639133 RepID=UPI001580E08B|nr:hypothetical protein [Citrobacter portucalensis]NUH56262.1 hypothetical protein [Citrobacter portucalensis]NUH56541.1 hypothetical protein [Citrobacter portucalensis]